jgi:hypothetical protein
VFQAELVDKEWCCNKGEFKAVEVETLTGDVS